MEKVSNVGLSMLAEDYFMLDYQMLAENNYISQLLEMYQICEVRCSLSTWIRFEMLRLPSYLTGACGRDLWA